MSTGSDEGNLGQVLEYTAVVAGWKAFQTSQMGYVKNCVCGKQLWSVVLSWGDVKNLPVAPTDVSLRLKYSMVFNLVHVVGMVTSSSNPFMMHFMLI